MRQHESANAGTNLCKNIHCPCNIDFAIVVQARHLGLMYFIDFLYVQTGNDLIQPASFSILSTISPRQRHVIIRRQEVQTLTEESVADLGSGMR